MAEKYKEGHFDAGMMENTRRREHQHKPDEGQVLFGSGGHRHGFADEAAEQGKRRYGGGPDHAADRRKGHGFVEPAQIRGPDLAGHVEHGPGGHEQERLVNNVAKGMRHHPVDGQLGADPDAADHKSHLIDQAVGQHPPHIVDDNSIEI
jgi:hypothetical protein